MFVIFVTALVQLRLMVMNHPDDIEYIHRVKDGDIEAFSFLVSRYQRMIFSLVVKTVGDEMEAEDITQEIFIKVYQSLSKFREDSKFSTWVYRIACNFCFSQLRKHKDEVVSLNEEIQTGEQFSDFEEKLAQSQKEERIRLLDNALKKLPPEELWIVTLYYKENVPVNEISKITGIGESNVKVKLFRTRKWLKSEIEKQLKL